VAKTSGKVRRTPKQRHWRKTKIKCRRSRAKRETKEKGQDRYKGEDGSRLPRKRKEDSLAEKPEQVSLSKRRTKKSPRRFPRSQRRSSRLLKRLRPLLSLKSQRKNELEIVEENSMTQSPTNMERSAGETDSESRPIPAREFVAQRMKTTKFR